MRFYDKSEEVLPKSGTERITNKFLWWPQQVFENTYTNHKIYPVIPGHTPGAGKCVQCGKPVSWAHSRIELDNNGHQVGRKTTFHCNDHKPTLPS